MKSTCSTFLILCTSLFFSLLSCQSPVAKYINAPEVRKWEADIQVFDSLNQVEASGPNTLLVTGSSSVRLWHTVQRDLQPYQVLQRGYGGAKLSDYIYYMERIIPPHDFKAIVLFIANDISGGGQSRTPKEMFQLYRTLARKVKKRHPNTPLFWVETTPTPSRWEVWPQVSEANKDIRDFAERFDLLHFIATSEAYLNAEARPDSSYFVDDMLHLNDQGYALWSELILKALDEAGIQP